MDYTVRKIDKLLRFDSTAANVVVTLLPFSQTPNAPYEIQKISVGDGHTVTIRVDPATADFLLSDGSTSIALNDTNNTVLIRIPADGESPAFVNTGGGSGGGGGGTDAIGPVTGFTSQGEVGTRYVKEPDRLVHLTVGFVPICPLPQPVTYFISADNGATWVWIGWQRMKTVGQQLLVDRLAPGVLSTWRVAAGAGTLGGDPVPIPDASLNSVYPTVVRSGAFSVAGLSTPPISQGITATIGAQTDVIGADGFTHYYRIPPVTYQDPTGSTDFFVRITVEDRNAGGTTLVAERPYGGTQITGGLHTEPANISPYSVGVAYVRYRFYVANRNSQGEGDFSDTTTNKLQMVVYNGGAAADHYDVPITIPPFTAPDPGGAFNVTSVTASEVGPKYQDEKQGLHTTIGVIPVIDVDYTSLRTVTIWFDFGNGQIVWQGWYGLTALAQVIRIGDATLGTDGTRKSGDIWVPMTAGQGNWKCYCKSGRVDKGVDPTGSAQALFVVTPAAACPPNGTTNAMFVANPATSDPIVYSKKDPGIWFWEYYKLTWLPPSITTDPNYWFTLITIQKGGMVSGTWTPAPDYEGANSDPSLQWLGRAHVQVTQLPGIANDQRSVIEKYGAQPATWPIPPAQNTDLTPNQYRDYRFLLYNVSRLGSDTSGSGGAGTYTLQTSCWPGGLSYYILTPQPKQGDLDFRAANPATITLPLTGGNGQPLTVQPYSGPGTGIGSNYLPDDSILARHMAQDSITAANQALAAGSVVDPNIVTVGINKVTYGTSVFAGDVVLSRGVNLPVIVLQNTGIFLYGQGDGTGHAGLTSFPYVGIQNNAIGLFQGSTGGSILISAASGAITIYSKNGDTSAPYYTVNATALSFVNGSSSMAINSNALAFIDNTNGNRVDLNSAGMSMAHGTNKLVVTATDLQLQLAGVARVTINAGTGITLSNGGTSSVVVSSATVQITTTGAQTTMSSNQIQMVSGTSSVTITPSLVTIVNGSLSSPIITVTGSTFVVNINTTVGIKVTDTGNNNYVSIPGDGIGVANSGNTAGVYAAVRTGPGTAFGQLEIYGNGGAFHDLVMKSLNSSVASSGSQSLPANPAGFLTWTWDGATIHVPYYN